jgi:hypothetical protein
MLSSFPKKIFFYNKLDSKKEPIFSQYFNSRLKAAEYFSKIKKLKLKDFLKIYSISR